MWLRIHGRFISDCQPDSKFIAACVQTSLPHDWWPQFPAYHMGLSEPSRQVLLVESSAFLAWNLCHQEPRKRQGTPWSQEVARKWQPQSSP